MSEVSYPYVWADLSPEDDQVVKRNYGELGHCRDIVRSNPELIRVGSSIRNHYMRLFTMKIRPDDVWIVTHPKCGTTWTQEMTWHIMTGVDLETAKLPLYNRSPFIDMVMIRDVSKEETDRYFDDLEKVSIHLKAASIFMTHYTGPLSTPHQDSLPFRAVAACTPGHLQGALCQQECEGCSRVIFPP